MNILIHVLTFSPSQDIQVSLGGNASFMKFGHIMFVFGFCMKNKMYCCSYHPTSDHYIKTQLSLLFIQNFFSCLLLQCNIAQYLWAFLFVYLISYTHCTLCFIKNIVSKYCSLFCTSNSSVVLLIESSLHFR